MYGVAEGSFFQQHFMGKVGIKCKRISIKVVYYMLDLIYTGKLYDLRIESHGT